MDGITVLNKTLMSVRPDWFAPVIFILIAIMMFAGNAFFHAISQTGMTIAASLMFFCCGSIIGVLIFAPYNSTDRYMYEVTINKSVSFVDVLEKYDVVEQRGDIWILEDKKGEKK